MGTKFIDDEHCSEAARDIIKYINCPHKIISKENTEEDVNREYDEAFIRGKSEGFVPVLVPADETLAEWFGMDDSDENYAKEKIIESEKNSEKSGGELLDEWYNQYIEDFYEDYEKGEAEFKGEFDDKYDINSLSSFGDFHGGIEETILFEIPVKNPWEVIAWIPFGGWNECPAPVEMITICHDWYDKYKAVPAAITHDQLEFIVEEPISDEETAWKVAKQHYAFCTDRVDQCTETGTLGEVAGSILNSKVWYFWWD